MQIYLLNLGWLTTLVIAFHFVKNTKFKQTILLVSLFIPLFLLSALRDKTVGTDTANYIKSFGAIADLSFQTCLEGMAQFETGFVIFNKVVSLLTVNPQIFIAICSFLTISLIFIFIKNYSDIPWLSVYLFITLNYYQQSFNAIRQFLALAIVLLGIKFIQERSISKFSSLLLFTISIHTVAWTFGFAYILEKIKVTTKLIFIIFGISVFFYVNFENILWLIELFARDRYYDRLFNVAPANGRTFLVALVMYAFCLTILQVKKIHSQDFNLWMCFIALLSYLFAMKAYEFVRLAEFFAIFFIVLIPNSIACINNKKLKVLVYVAIVILVLLSHLISGVLIGISRTIPYQFFQ